MALTKATHRMTNGASVNVKDYGAVGDGVTDDHTAILNAWTYCLANGKDMYFPSGTYVSETYSMPMGRIDGSAPSSLLDCKNITVFGDGRSTILKTKSALGADVIQINGAKNFHVKDLSITAELTGSAGAGSNAVSFTGGGDNITLENVYAFDLPYVDQTTFLDGGKGFTLQMSTFTPEFGTITIQNCIAKGCVYGFDVNPVLDDIVNEKGAVNIDGIAEDCWYGFIIGSPAAGVAIPAGYNSGTNIKGTTINCQHSVTLWRVHGGDYDVNIVNNKTKANLKLDPNGNAWSASLNLAVDGLVCTYVHNARISVYGYAKTVDYKARIGGTSAGSSGLTGATSNCQIYVDISGTADTADIDAVDSGGNIMTDCVLYVSTTTTSIAIPVALYNASYNNTITKGSARRIINTTVEGSLDFTYTDGYTSYNNIERDGLALYTQQTGGSSPNQAVWGVKSNTGAKVMTVYNNGAIGGGALNTASAVATIIKAMPIYDNAGAVVGYVPVYTSFS